MVTCSVANRRPPQGEEGSIPSPSSRGMSEDTIDTYISMIVSRLENIGLVLGDNEYDIFAELTHSYFEKYLSKERNYN